MSEILGFIDVNNYGLQSMINGGGGAEPEDLTLELAAQDTALSTQQTKIDELEAALDDKIALDLQAATADANAIPEDLVYGETAYVNGQKITGTANKVFSGDSAHATNISYDSYNGLIVALTRNNPPNLMLEKGAGLNIYPSDIATAINLQASQIKKDEVVLGVTGTYEGTSVPDWSQIGYSGVPQRLLDSFAYSKQIYDNWDNTQANLNDKFASDKNLVYMPLVDTSNARNCAGMFDFCSNLEILPLLNTSNVTQMQYFCNSCSKLISIPQLDTSKNTNFQSAFSGCSLLKNVPILNMEKIIQAGNMFLSCSSLSNDSLNNIMAMCMTTTSDYTGTKTLRTIGLSQAQATTCQTLSNWDAFVAAGWTSGY